MSFFIMQATNFFNELSCICVIINFFGVIYISAMVLDQYDVTN